MSLYQEWLELMNNQTEDTIQAFWEEYSTTEAKIYKHILSHKEENLSGTVSELVDFFQCNKVIFVGFLDGINTSIKDEIDLEKVDMDTKVVLDVDFEKLFFNMLKADADHLFSLDEWNDVLSEDKRREIYKDYKRSKTVHVEKKPGRNDPCPCGSGKKYKKCCGKNN